MVALLMPWKKLVDTSADKTVTIEHLITLFDMTLQNSDTWMIGPGNLDDTLEGKVHVLLGMTAATLFVLIVGFVASLFYPRETSYRFGIDLVGLIMGAVTLILAITFQPDFDKHWKHYAVNGDGGPVYRKDGHTRDADQMFLVVGVLAGQITLSLGLVADKMKEVLEKWRL
jgi:hypothetical protein